MTDRVNTFLQIYQNYRYYKKRKIPYPLWDQTRLQVKNWATNPHHPQHEIVIARYRENPHWSSNYRSIRTIYNKYHHTGSEYRHYPGPVLPNVGRESHTYLTHIVERWNTLRDFTFFTQAELDPRHQPYPVETYLLSEDFICNPTMTGVNFRDQPGGFIRHDNKWLEDYHDGFIRPAKLSLEQWWKEYLGLAVPDWKKLVWSHGAIFSVSRANIQKYERSYYNRLLSTISDHSNPEEGHYFERAWYSMFS